MERPRISPRIGRLLAIFLTLCPRSGFAASVTGPPVGDLGDASRWEIEGAKTFSALEIRRGLLRDFDVQLASHPFAPKDALVSVLREMILEGYLHAGFPDIRVEASADDPASRIDVRIDEGPRLRCGEIRIEGAKAVPVSRIRAALAGEGKTSESLPFWRPGAFAYFSRAARDWHTVTVSGEMRAAGRFFPRFRAEV
ncbi:MAG: hypothetical protein JXP34_02250, partial [Planctomycetes bacterium]|nr:hypothetical protein [Planctomycetota bacterium]